MKRIFALCILVSATLFVHSQSVIGFWQEKTPEVTDGYLNTYEFNNDGTFTFSTNQYFGLSRIINLGGTYKMKKDTLFLTVQYTTELVGGTIERSKESGTATNLWTIAGAKSKRINLPEVVHTTIQVEFQKSNIADSQLVLFDKTKYYKIEK